MALQFTYGNAAVSRAIAAPEPAPAPKQVAAPAASIVSAPAAGATAAGAPVAVTSVTIAPEKSAAPALASAATTPASSSMAPAAAAFPIAMPPAGAGVSASAAPAAAEAPASAAPPAAQFSPAAATAGSPLSGAKGGPVAVLPGKALVDKAVGDAHAGKQTKVQAGAAGSDATAGGPRARNAANDPAFQSVLKHSKAVAKHQAVHGSAQGKADEASAAAVAPPNDLSSRAAARQTATMEKQKPKRFDRETFKASLLSKIKAPSTLKEADDFKENNNLGEVKASVNSQVADQKKVSQGALPEKVAEKPDTAGIDPKTTTKLPEPDIGQGQNVSAGGAAPKPVGDSDISLESGPKEVDKQMADSNVTEEQLQKSNEPAFQSAAGQKKNLEKQSAEAPKAYRKEEKSALVHSATEAQSIANKHTADMHGARKHALGAVAGHQTHAQQEEEKKRLEVANHIEGIYKDTKVKVEARLKKLDEDVNKTFDDGATGAQVSFEDYVSLRMDAYKDDRYGSLIGKGRWVKDKFMGLPDDVNVFYKDGRDLYIRHMGEVIDRVATLVETGLNEAMDIITAGKDAIDHYVDKELPASLKGYGQKAAAGIQSKFESLEQSVNEKQDQLADSLSKKYNENMEKLDSRIEEMKAANRGLVDAVLDAVVGVIKTILQLKDMLLNVISRAASAIGMIIAHPIDFLGNLVDAGKQGFSQFVDHILEHLKQGFMEWLFGAVAETGIQLPKDFDLPGILSLVLQILGLTYSNIRSRAVKILGEKVVKALETAAEIFKILITKGPGGLWEYIKEKIGDLKAMVIEKIKSFVMEKIVMAGITWIIGLLNPASAFIKACKAIYDIIMFFVEHGKQILDLVNAIIDSITAIAKGQIGAAANWVEKTLARTIPVIIGFLASLLGVGGISEKIKEIIEAIRKPINEAIDWVINKAVDLVKAVGGLLGFGKDKDQDKKPEGAIEEPVPMHGVEHHVTVVPGPEPSVLIASDNAGKMAKKIDKAITHLEELGAPKKGQATALKRIQDKEVKLRKLLQDPKNEDKAKAATQDLVAQIVKYAGDFQVTDLEDIAAAYPAPIPGLYGALIGKEGKEKLPDGKTREAHHAPQVQFAKSLVAELKAAGKTLSRSDSDAAEKLVDAGDALQGVTGENALPAILVHQSTHRTHGAGVRIHGGEIREKLDPILKEKAQDGEIKIQAVAETSGGDTVVKPGAETYKREFRSYSKAATKEKSVSQALKKAGAEVVEDIYDAERERSLSAVEIAVTDSVVDGPKEEKPAVLKDFRRIATKAWDGFIKIAVKILK